ncbi:hypothetical protein Q3G72_012679 [Acer saccharum]|nr:hypothetical protein Q3G72_012679 [Acer saccharum]
MVFQDDVMTEGASNSRLPLLKGRNYGFWKLRMKAYIRSIDERAWITVEEGYLTPTKSEEGVTVSKPRKTAKEAWEALQVTNEGTKAVKKSRLQLLTSQFEVLQMGEEDKFVDFQDKLLDIANQCQALGAPISSKRLNWKILISLPKRFKAKVTAIEESKDVDFMSLDELLRSFQTFEEVKKSFTPPYERSGHAKSNRKVQCFKCKKFGHYASDCPSGDSKKDNKGKAMAATWSEDDDSSDKESSSDESSSEEELVSNFVAFMASHSTLEDVNQDSLDKEIDPSYQECLNDNPTYIDLLAKVKFLEEKLKIALREVDKKDDLIKIQVDEFVATTRRLLGEKNALAKKLCEVEGIVLKKDRIISNLSLGSSSDTVVEEKLIEASLPTSEVIVEEKAPKKRRSKKKNKLNNKVPLETPICTSPTPKGKISHFVPICHFCNTIGHIKPNCYKFIEYCNLENASRNREIVPHFMHVKTFEYGKHDNISKHVKNVRKVKNAYPSKFDNACVANNVEKKSFIDIIVNQVVEKLYSRFNIVVKENLDNVRVSSPKTKFVKGECSYH